MTLGFSVHFRLLVIIVVFLASLLGACSDDDESGSTTTTSTATTASTTESTTTSTSGTTESTTTSTSGTTESTTTSSATSSTTTPSTTAEPSTTTANRVVEVYFSTGDGTDCGEVSAFERTVEASIGPARAAFEELVGGPTPAEEAEGASSFYSSATTDAIESVSLTDGVLTVDLADIRAEISNAGTSCGSAAFTSSLNATAFQFPTVDKARYLFAGSCDNFGGFIQADFCEFNRDG